MTLRWALSSNEPIKRNDTLHLTSDHFGLCIQLERSDLCPRTLGYQSEKCQAEREVMPTLCHYHNCRNILMGGAGCGRDRLFYGVSMGEKSAPRFMDFRQQCHLWRTRKPMAAQRDFTGSAQFITSTLHLIHASNTDICDSNYWSRDRSLRNGSLRAFFVFGDVGTWGNCEIFSFVGEWFAIVIFDLSGRCVGASWKFHMLS